VTLQAALAFGEKSSMLACDIAE